MKPKGTHNYFVYILTNLNKTVIYVGVTNNLERRLQEHADSATLRKHFTGKYNVVHLIYWEHHTYILNAIAREKELKGWRRSKKFDLINQYGSLDSEFQYFSNTVSLPNIKEIENFLCAIYDSKTLDQGESTRFNIYYQRDIKIL